MACSKAAYLDSIQQVLANNFGISLLRSLRTAVFTGRETLDKPRSTGPHRTLLGYTLGWREARHTQDDRRVLGDGM